MRARMEVTDTTGRVWVTPATDFTAEEEAALNQGMGEIGEMHTVHVDLEDGHVWFPIRSVVALRLVKLDEPTA